MRQLSVGIIGFGFMGRTHSYGYLNMPLFYDPVPAAAKITHVCEFEQSLADRAAATIGAEHAVTDFRRITENPAVGIVDICLPNHLHRDALLSAMAAGKHIYCDKPLTATLAEAEEVAAALPGYRGVGMMALQNRFFPATLRAKQLVDSEFLGQVLQFRASYLHAGSADPKAPLKWKLSADAGGGVIADLASHVLDLVSHLLGDFTELIASTQIAYPTRPAADDPSRRVPVEAEDNVAMLVRMRSGATGVIEATKLATGAEDELRVEVHGSRGAIRFNSMDPHHVEVYDASAADQPAGGTRGWTRVDAGQRYPKPAVAFPSPKMAVGWLRAHLACQAHFLSRVAAGAAGEPSLAQGVRIQRLMEVVRESAKTKQWMRL
jgi:predicted dehydrogenase